VSSGLRRGVFAAAWLALTGCAVGPNYERPAVSEPQTFRGQAAAEPVSVADLPWFEVFQDPVLAGLVREALTNNYDLLAAAARVEQARYFAAVTRSELFPQVGYESDIARGERSFLLTPSPFADKSANSSWLTVLNVAWEIDVWGRIRRSTEAARADLLATDAFRRGVVLSLVSDVATAYFSLRELDLELEIARRTEESFTETRDLFQRQFQGGVTSKLDPLRAEAALAQVSASIPELERRIVAQENLLSVLLGRPPGEIPRGAALAEQPVVPEIPAGVPSLLLERRPDIVQAEQNLVAANARIGVAFAEFFPRIGLTAFAGAVSSELRDALDTGAVTWAAAASALGPLFTFGQTWYGWEASKASADEARVAYQGRVLIALEEVSDALTSREKLTLVRAEQERAVEALREALRIARVRYTGGLSNYLDVLDAQQQLFPAENDLARTQRDELLAIVDLYRTLGGGWSQGEPEPTIPQPIAP
jgi:multidrug efflux system outer membrane protein